MPQARSENDPDQRQASTRSALPPQQEEGERVLEAAVRLATRMLGARLIAAYALGSLAHGGFSPYVSDVDVGLVLSDPLLPEDAATIGALANAVKAEGAPLADRLSIFWGTLTTLCGEAAGGRFPPLDRLDLKQWGRLLTGRDICADIPAPTQRELIVAGAGYALLMLTTPQVIDDLRHPAMLVDAGVRTLTKIVLYPVRFLFTAETGAIGRNDAAVEYVTATRSGPAADLARRALDWRREPPDPSDSTVLEALEGGLLPLYRMFLDEYVARLRQFGEELLAQAFEAWRRGLD